jgi:hypothetical protein
METIIQLKIIMKIWISKLNNKINITCHYFKVKINKKNVIKSKKNAVDYNNKIYIVIDISFFLFYDFILNYDYKIIFVIA